MMLQVSQGDVFVLYKELMWKLEDCVSAWSQNKETYEAVIPSKNGTNSINVGSCKPKFS